MQDFPVALVVRTAASTEKRLNISARTLQRRLNDWGISFEELVDEYRRERALKLLLHVDRSILEVAYSLGYSDPAHSTRAFRRWTGMSPKSYRTALLTGLTPDAGWAHCLALRSAYRPAPIVGFPR